MPCAPWKFTGEFSVAGGRRHLALPYFEDDDCPRPVTKRGGRRFSAGVSLSDIGIFEIFIVERLFSGVFSSPPFLESITPGCAYIFHPGIFYHTWFFTRYRENSFVMILIAGALFFSYQSFCYFLLGDWNFYPEFEMTRRNPFLQRELLLLFSDNLSPLHKSTAPQPAAAGIVIFFYLKFNKIFDVFFSGNFSEEGK